MDKQVSISPIQLSLLLMGFLFGTTIFIVPGIHAAQNAWLSFILAWGGGLVLFSCYALLSKRHHKKTLVEINQELLGKVLGNLLSILYIWYFIHLGALVLRNFGEYGSIVHLVETPSWFVMGVLLFAVAYSVKSGLEVTARTAEMMVPLVFIFQFVMTLLLVKHIDLSNLRPFLADGLPPVFRASISILTFPFGETVVFLMILPYLNQQKKLKKAYLSAFGLVGSALLIVLIRDLTILGATGIQRKLFPPHLVAKHIGVLDFDSIVGIMFFISAGAKLCICYIAAAIGIAQLTGSKNHRIFTYPVGVILLGLSLWVYEGAPEMLTWAAHVWPVYSIPFQFIFPFLLLFLSFLKKGTKQNSESIYRK